MWPSQKIWTLHFFSYEVNSIHNIQNMKICHSTFGQFFNTERIFIGCHNKWEWNRGRCLLSSIQFGKTNKLFSGFLPESGVPFFDILMARIFNIYFRKEKAAKAEHCAQGSRIVATPNAMPRSFPQRDFYTITLRLQLGCSLKC